MGSSLPPGVPGGRTQLCPQHTSQLSRYADTVAREWQQQCQRIAIAGLCVAGKVAFAHQVLQEEATNPWPKKIFIIHGCLRSLRTWQSADWLPAAVPASSADSSG